MQPGRSRPLARREIPDPRARDRPPSRDRHGARSQPEPRALKTVTTHSVAETERVAAELARTFHGGECVALDGDLGAGKTQFVRGLLKGLRGDPRTVSSPTFILLNVYDTGRLKLYHLDAYRVSGAEDFEAIGFAELLEQGGVVVVEWAQRVADLLPPNRINIGIGCTGATTRRIAIVCK